MVQRLAACILILAFGFSSMVMGQGVEKGASKEVKPAVAGETKKEVKPAVIDNAKKDAKKQTKPVTMKSIACTQSGCGFAARGHSAKELRSIMKRHYKRHQKTELTDKQLKEMVKTEGSK